jgi:hypothetical protein
MNPPNEFSRRKWNQETLAFDTTFFDRVNETKTLQIYPSTLNQGRRDFGYSYEC